MKPDWSRVTVDDVRRACEMYDSGDARPRRPAKSTFLIVSGKTYPAKFIRGLAYHLATGIELDPNQDYSGGTETARFFQRLGVETQHELASTENPPAVNTSKAPTSPMQPATPSPSRPSSYVRQRGREPQKAALAALLHLRFGEFEREKKFPWLMVPSFLQMDVTIRAIYDALQAMRGHSTFASSGYSLRCDFFVPAERLVIEYDERQHFTAQRAKSLELYPPDLALGFDRQEWVAACRAIGAKDPAPPDRDEQRAFYDTLRDILTAQNGIRLIRLRCDTFDWTSPHADAQLDNVLASGHASFSQPAVRPAPEAVANLAVGQIRKVALVSHNYTVRDSHGLFDYSEHFAQINKLCDAQGCDTILYSLYTWDPDSTAIREHDAIFGGLDYVQRIILEVGQRAPKPIEHIEIWSRGQYSPLMAKQRFARSSEPAALKLAFMNDLPDRRVADGLLVSCGETNIASMAHHRDFDDPYGFTNRLWEMKIGPILNPIHDKMTRFEMKMKRRHYSLGGRTVISVWNEGRGREAPAPWTVFHDGVDRTDAVRELDCPFSDRPDIRIGIIDLATL